MNPVVFVVIVGLGALASAATVIFVWPVPAVVRAWRRRR